MSIEFASETSLKGAVITVTAIGEVDNGCDGGDSYVLLERKDGDLTPEQAEEWLLPQVFFAPDIPGSYYCRSVVAMAVPYSTSKVVCIVERRYDV